MAKTALLIITLMGFSGEPAVIKHREVLDMATCRPLALMLTEPRRVHAQCVRREKPDERGLFGRR